MNSETQLSINYTLVDKETHTIESTLTLSNVTSLFHMSNFTCKLVQIQDQVDMDVQLKPSEFMSLSANEQPFTNILELKTNSSELAKEFASKQQFWQSSRPITLNVGFKPMVSVEVFNKITHAKLVTQKLSLYNDTDIVFNCLHRSNPIEPVQVRWLLNGQPQTQPETTGSHVFKWLQRSNRFDVQLQTAKVNLTCEISNAIGTGSFTHEITVLREPVITCDKQVYDVDESNPLQVNCVAHASPSVSHVEWRHYLQNTTSELFHTVANSSVLDFKSVKYREHSGYYDFVATNAMKDSFGQSRTGRTQLRIELNVRFMPQINVIAKKMAANLSEATHAVTCMTMSNPQPEFKWYKNGMQLSVNR